MTKSRTVRTGPDRMAPRTARRRMASHDPGMLEELRVALMARVWEWRLLACLAVQQFSSGVGMAGMPGCLIDEVHEYPAEVGFLFPDARRVQRHRPNRSVGHLGTITVRGDRSGQSHPIWRELIVV